MNQPTRFHSLDVVRAVALLLGIVLHGTLSFWPGFREARWPISDDSSSLAMSGLFFVAHIFRMSLFFVIAGFFAHVLLERLGAWGLVRNRLRRIALPLVVSMVVVMPLLLLPFFWGQRQLGLTGPPDLSPPIPHPQMPPWGHLWFLYLLLVLYALWLAGRGLVALADRQGAAARGIDRVLGTLMEYRVAPLLLGVPAAVALHHSPWWILWQGIPAPIMGFIPNFPAVLAYGAAFGFGWFLHRQTALLHLLTRDWPWYLGAAAVLSAVALALVGARPELHVHEVPMVKRAVYAVTYMVAGWCWILALIGVAVRFLAQPSAAWRYLADASFFVYIMHLPVVYLLQAWMLRWPWHWSLKYLLIVTLTLGITLAMYHYLVRSTFVGQFLNGRRLPRNPRAISAPSTSPG